MKLDKTGKKKVGIKNVEMKYKFSTKEKVEHTIEEKLMQKEKYYSWINRSEEL